MSLLEGTIVFFELFFSPIKFSKNFTEPYKNTAYCRKHENIKQCKNLVETYFHFRSGRTTLWETEKKRTPEKREANILKIKKIWYSNKQIRFNIKNKQIEKISKINDNRCLLYKIVHFNKISQLHFTSLNSTTSLVVLLEPSTAADQKCPFASQLKLSEDVQLTREHWLPSPCC